MKTIESLMMEANGMLSQSSGKLSVNNKLQ